LREEIGEELLVMGYSWRVYVVSLIYLGWRVKTCGRRNDAREKES
jgi:hypothetical protein